MSIRMTRSVTCSPTQNPSREASSAFGCPSGVLKSFVTVAFLTGGEAPGAAGGARPLQAPAAAPVSERRHLRRRDPGTERGQEVPAFMAPTGNCSSCMQFNLPQRAEMSISLMHGLALLWQRCETNAVQRRPGRGWAGVQQV